VERSHISARPRGLLLNVPNPLVRVTHSLEVMMDREGNPDIGYHSEPLWMPLLYLLSTHAIILICVLPGNMVKLSLLSQR
jgi:hypothetical protein